MSDASSRLLDLLSLLQAPPRLARRRAGRAGSGVSGRTVRRDVGRLRELGYPVESLTGPAGGYRLRAGTAMPPLLLDEEEAIAIAVGLRTAARASVTGIEETSIRALVKLEQVLPAHLRRRVTALGSATIARAGHGPDRRPAAPHHDRRGLPRLGAPAVRAIAAATARRPGATSSRTRWSTSGGAGTSSAGTARREDWRTFRVDRLTRPAATGVRFTPRTLPASDAAAYVAAEHLGGPATATRRGSRCTRPADRIARRLPWVAGALDADRRAPLRVPDRRTTISTGWRSAS